MKPKRNKKKTEKNRKNDSKKSNFMKEQMIQAIPNHFA